MSGGAIVVAPVVTAGAVVVVGAAVAAAVVIRAAQAGTEAAGRALERFGEEAERAARAQDEDAVRSRLWDLAATAVVGVDQDLRLLRARAAKAGVTVPLPLPLDLAGQTLADVRAWAVRIEPELAEARARIEGAEADREKRDLLGKLPVPAGGAPTAAELLAHYQEQLKGRRRAAADAPQHELPRQLDKKQVEAEIDRILTRLDIDASSVDRAEVINAAALVSKQTDIGTSRTYLNALARKVDTEVNPRIAARRTAASWLAALEHPVVAAAIDEASPRPPFLRAMERLRAVVAGDAELTGADRNDAQQSLAWARREVDRQRLLEVLAEAFTGLGYSVATGMQVNHAAALGVDREGWHAEHDARVWVDERGSVQWRLVQRSPDATDSERRCKEINESMRTIGTALRERGFDIDVAVPDSLTPPIAQFDRRPGESETNTDIADEAQVRYRDVTEEDR